ncbi:DeoR family transcriptional regulator [Paraoerskovia sediminicola]|uniref:DeoR family transcriptional regulator n=1 Tax=Paraoerskovia sediminicola TaxID=1138587 RepID=A0ABN6XBR1_9CELL|nr:DeoR/GlpR family DNA-binding transcription regulator [Paraoerskovia sediminicola]BDZ42267.1 DeoR family transcriptional regulator [Paraoerskovia sediminicola]
MPQSPQDHIPRATSRKRTERLLAILELVTERESVALGDLTQELGVSEATVRRDLMDMEDQGLLTRTHGGARSHESREEVPVRLRDSRFREAKRLIARRAVELVPTGPYSVAISGGTTTAEVTRLLATRENLAIVTNSLTTVMEIASRPNLKVMMTGGVVRSSSFEAVGILAENTFNAVNVGTAILGTDGISAQGGVTTHDDTEARTNHAMVTNAQTVMVVADGSKVGRLTLAKMAELSEVDMLITDSSADPDELDRIRAAGVEIHVVGG